MRTACTGSGNGEAAPEKASKPFDKRRDGLIPSGGAASLVLESYESAVKRGAPILAEVIGYGFSSNGDHISVPNVDGPSRRLSKGFEAFSGAASWVENALSPSKLPTA